MIQTVLTLPSLSQKHKTVHNKREPDPSERLEKRREVKREVRLVSWTKLVELVIKDGLKTIPESWRRDK
ncbi:Protein of unknown function [Pyronema omphalodes CBS 100304]|uniref:Uncharacterized protein n=1 Tax=Pyronema omphalodes (strain CBS 100304) TaxID=1076935 RepID=U4LRQ4_PYROM|nr:Protein of unknown function [Pyronema omphalodes CBS 100304]